jgi:chromosome segregation ATPase
MKSMMGLPRLPLVLLAAALTPDVAQAALCHCLGFGGSDSGLLLQGHGKAARPRDCTCITGVKSYQTTPRDQLMAMGEVGLRSHYSKCKREKSELTGQKEYQVAAAEAQVKNVQKQLGRMNEAVSKTKTKADTKHSKLKEQKAEIQQKVDKQEEEVRTLKKEQAVKFTEWFKSNQAIKATMGRFFSCNCKQDEAVASFLAAGSRGGRGGGSLTPSQEVMYDLRYKVEDCEGAVIKLSADIDAALLKESKATASLSSSTEHTRRKLDDHARLAKMMNVQPQIESLKSRQEILNGIVDAERDQVERYVKANSELKKHLESLDAELKKCQC